MLSPRVLILDEPVSSLDAPTRHGILDLLVTLQAAQGIAYLFISHDLEVVGALSHRIAVMYRGRIVEMGSVDEITLRPGHPYTRALLAAQPARHPRDRGKLKRLASGVDYGVAAGDSSK